MTPTRAGRRGAVVRSVAGERRSSRKRAGRLRYDPQWGGDPSGVIREPAVPFTWKGIEYRSRRACAGVGSGLVPQCLRRPSVGGPLRGDEESGKHNANNNLDALHRGWRGARSTYIANIARKPRTPISVCVLPPMDVITRPGGRERRLLPWQRTKVNVVRPRFELSPERELAAVVAVFGPAGNRILSAPVRKYKSASRRIGVRKATLPAVQLRRRAFGCTKDRVEFCLFRIGRQVPPGGSFCHKACRSEKRHYLEQRETSEYVVYPGLLVHRLFSGIVCPAHVVCLLTSENLGNHLRVLARRLGFPQRAREYRPY